MLLSLDRAFPPTDNVMVLAYLMRLKCLGLRLPSLQDGSECGSSAESVSGSFLGGCPRLTNGSHPVVEIYR